MAGPIRDLISMIRERRQQRREDGPGMFPRLRERFGERMDGERSSGPRIRGMMQMGRGVPSPTEEIEPETLPTPAGESSRVKATSVSTKGAPGTLSGPAPVTGDQNSLPDVPATDMDSLTRQYAEQLGRLGQETDPARIAAIKAQAAGTRSLIELGTIRSQLDEKKKSATLQYNMDEVSGAARQAVQSGNFAPLESLVYGSDRLTPKDSTGAAAAGLKPDVRSMVRPAAREYVANLLNNKDYGALTQNEKAVMYANIAYAYPVTLVDSKTNAPLKPEQMVAEADRLYGELSVDFPVATPELRNALRLLANKTVRQQAARLGVRNLTLPTNP